jgi:hypothetical protein
MPYTGISSQRCLSIGQARNDWPCSGERIVGRRDVAAIQARYPTNTGRWSFDVHRLVADGDTVVSEVTATDGEQSARAVVLSDVDGEHIAHQVEYWPTAYDPPAGREDLTRPTASLNASWTQGLQGPAELSAGGDDWRHGRASCPWCCGGGGDATSSCRLSSGTPRAHVRMLRCHLARVLLILAAWPGGVWSIWVARQRMRCSGPGTCLP